MNCQSGAVLIWEDTLEEGNLVLEMLSLARRRHGGNMCGWAHVGCRKPGDLRQGSLMEFCSPVSWEQQSQQGGGQSVKHRLLRVVQRLFQYQVLLTGGPHRRSRCTKLVWGGEAPAEGWGRPGKVCDETSPPTVAGRGGRKDAVTPCRGARPSHHLPSG